MRYFIKIKDSTLTFPISNSFANVLSKLKQLSIRIEKQDNQCTFVLNNLSCISFFRGAKGFSSTHSYIVVSDSKKVRINASLYDFLVECNSLKMINNNQKPNNGTNSVSSKLVDKIHFRLDNKGGKFICFYQCSGCLPEQLADATDDRVKVQKLLAEFFSKNALKTISLTQTSLRNLSALFQFEHYLEKKTNKLIFHNDLSPGAPISMTVKTKLAKKQSKTMAQAILTELFMTVDNLALFCQAFESSFQNVFGFKLRWRQRYSVLFEERALSTLSRLLDNPLFIGQCLSDSSSLDNRYQTKNSGWSLRFWSHLTPKRFAISQEVANAILAEKDRFTSVYEMKITGKLISISGNIIIHDEIREEYFTLDRLMVAGKPYTISIALYKFIAKLGNESFFGPG